MSMSMRKDGVGRSLTVVWWRLMEDANMRLLPSSTAMMREQGVRVSRIIVLEVGRSLASVVGKVQVSYDSRWCSLTDI